MAEKQTQSCMRRYIRKMPPTHTDTHTHTHRHTPQYLSVMLKALAFGICQIVGSSNCLCVCVCVCVYAFPAVWHFSKHPCPGPGPDTASRCVGVTQCSSVNIRPASHSNCRLRASACEHVYACQHVCVWECV